METKSKTMIVIGASRGIATAVARAFSERSYNVIANSLRIAQSEVETSKSLALAQGELAEPATGFKIATTAINKFGSIDSLVNNRGSSLPSRSRDTPVRARSGPRRGGRKSLNATLSRSSSTTRVIERTSYGTQKRHTGKHKISSSLAAVAAYCQGACSETDQQANAATRKPTSAITPGSQDTETSVFEISGGGELK
jgi:NAD(P)-dependent dehydrogenase (short-subunit alcohol dehydrogenase family)